MSENTIEALARAVEVISMELKFSRQELSRERTSVDILNRQISHLKDRSDTEKETINSLKDKISKLEKLDADKTGAQEASFYQFKNELVEFLNKKAEFWAEYGVRKIKERESLVDYLKALLAGLRPIGEKRQDLHS